MWFYLYVAGLALTAFYVGLRMGLAPGKARHDAKPRGMLAMLVGTVFCLGVFQLAQGNIHAPAAGVGVYGVMFLSALLALGGFGAFVGSLAARLPPRGLGRRAAIAGAVVLPSALAGAGIYSIEMQERAQEAALAKARAHLQSQTFRATFAGHTVTFPGAPIVELRHDCRPRRSACVTMFSFATELNGTTPESLTIRSFALNTQDAVLAANGAWCADRSELASSVWCVQAPDLRIKLRADEDLAQSEMDLPLTCSEYWKPGFRCRTIQRIADGIFAELVGTGATRAEAEAATLEERARADALWEALSSF